MSSEKKLSSQEAQAKWESERPCSAERLASSATATTFVKIQAVAADANSNETVAIFVTEEETQAIASGKGENPFDVSFAPLQVGDFKGKLRSKIVVYGNAGSKVKRVILVGLGSEKDVTIDVLRAAAHHAAQGIAGCKADCGSIVVPNTKLDAAAATDAITRSCFLSLHRFDKYLTQSEDTVRLSSLDLLYASNDALFSSGGAATVITTANKVTTGTILAREVANDRADVVNPAYMEARAADLAKAHGLQMTVLQHDELLKQGYNLISAVGQGATVGPRLVALFYQGDASKSTADVALVGKGITFDSGGLNMKGTGFIEDMHLDMGGSAAVMGAIKAISLLKPKTNVVGVLALAENATGSKAFKPHAIINSKKGSVEIGNTDAEGRLVLADALQFAQTTYQPTHIIDLATLTGACVVALGEYLAGAFSNDDGMRDQVVACGNKTFERCWPLPLMQEYTDELKGNYSDVRNMGKSRYGGASLAAAFLKRYIEKDVKWTHLDIAGPGMYGCDRDFMCKGGTGFGVQVLLEYILTHHEQK